MRLNFGLGLGLLALPLAACGGGDAFSTRSGAADAGVGGSAGGTDGSSGGGKSTGGGTSSGGGTSMGGGTSTGGASSDSGTATGGADASSGGATTSSGGTDAGPGAGGGGTVEAGTVDSGRSCGPTEICGDGIDNDCNGKTDEGCRGIGTWVSALTGDDQNPGTQKAPLKTIGAGIKNALAIGGGTDVYVAEGQYPEKVVLVDGVSLLGGYSCTQQACSWTRALRTYKSEIVNTDFEGVLVGSTIGRQTLLEGFTITGLDGASSVAPGNVGVTVLGGAATISRNVIVGGSATPGGLSNGQSVGIAVLAPPSAASAGPLIDSNDVRGGDSTIVSVGVEFGARPGVSGQTLGTVTQNVIQGGSAPSTFGILAFTSNHSVDVRNNSIWAGEATGSGGTAWGISVASAMTIDSNVINNASGGGKATCAAALVWCGGIQSSSSITIITNNVIHGADSTLSAGVSLEEAEKPAGSVVLNSNYIDGGGAGGALSSSAAIRLRIGTCNTCGFIGSVGRIRNDILVGGKSGARFALLEDPPSGKQQHPEAFENNQLYVSSSGAGDALYVYNDGSTATKITSIATINGLGATLTGIPFNANQEGDPKVDTRLHLLPGSPCIDRGTAAEAPAKDFERDSRPRGNGFDIGPDETN